MTVRFHLFPFRTQQLSSLVPKIVSWKRLVKIGSRRLEYAALRVLRAVFFLLSKGFAECGADPVLETHQNWVNDSPLGSIRMSGNWLKENL